MVPETLSTPQARLILLGAPHIALGDEVVQITHRKPLALLAYLAVTGQLQSRETLATLFWPEHDTSRAYAYLRNALWQLGQTLVGDWLSADQDTVTINEQAWVDVVHVERHLAAIHGHDHPPRDLCPACLSHLEEGTALYGGDFLEGFSLEDSPAFDEWQFFQTEHLRQAIATAMERLAHYRSAQGDIEAALSVARRWAALDPLNEPAHRCLMQLYATNGQRAVALHQYDALLRRLRIARLEPASETISLYQQIRAGKVQERPSQPLPAPIAQPAARPRYNLPAQTTQFVGRRDELAQLGTLLMTPACRLITLSGPGGIGKTRLALQAAEQHREAFDGGAFFVPLAAVSAPDLLIPAIAEALGTTFYPQSGIRPVDQLLAYLGDRRTLLILDNMEHLVEDTEVLTAILTRAPDIVFLVTSRERLNLQGEWVMELDGLSYPAGREETAAGYDAVALFVETARRVSSSFAPTRVEMDAIAEICKLVDGIPLGIELAAAWTKMLPCTEIAEEVAASLDFLTLTLRDLPERHQSLRAVFARSWGLLSEEERRHFRAVSVFRGGFDREAARQVAGAGLPALSGLMDKSLLRRTPEGRYEVLEILRQYAEEQLRSVPGEAETIAARHAAYYLDLVAQMEPPLKGDALASRPVGQRKALDTMQRDLANIRLAWDWSLRQGDTDALLRASVGFALFYEIRSRFREGEALFRDTVLALRRRPNAGDSMLLWGALALQGQFVSRLGRLEEGQDLIEEGYQHIQDGQDATWVALLEVLSSYVGVGASYEARQRRLRNSIARYETLEDTWGIALGSEVLASTYLRRDTAEMARGLLERSLRLRQERGDDWGAAMTLYSLGITRALQGQPSECLQLMEQSLALRTELRDIRGMAICQNVIARIMHDQGEIDAAERMQTASIQGFQEIGDIPGVIGALMALGYMARSAGRPEKAGAAFVTAQERARMIGHDAAIAASLHQLGQLALESGDPASARTHLEESLHLFDRLGNEEALAAVQADLARL